MDIISPRTLNILLNTLSGISKERGDSTETQKTSPNLVRTFHSKAKADFKSNLQAQALNRMDQAALMKELLNLPKDMKTLLAMLAYKNPSSKDIAQLLQNKTTITPEMINQLLQTSSKEVINKLIMLIQQSPGQTQNHDQLKQLLGLINQVTPSREANPQETLTQLLLMYLPWLPLAEDQKIEVWFEKKKSGEEEDEKIAMVVYVSTVNLGRFKITILIDKNNNLDIFIEHITEKDSEKPSEESKNIIENILKSINTEIKDEKIPAKTYMSEVKQKNFKESEERRVTISKVNNISPAVILSARNISRIILEADEKISLQERRKDLSK